MPPLVLRSASPRAGTPPAHRRSARRLAPRRPVVGRRRAARPRSRASASAAGCLVCALWVPSPHDHMAGVAVRGVAGDVRHVARAHAGAGEAGGVPGAEGAAAAARGVAARARGWRTLPLPAPDGSGVFAVALDLCSHEAVVAHGDGRVERVPLGPDRAVRDVTREVMAAVGELAGHVTSSTSRRRRRRGRCPSTRTTSTPPTTPTQVTDVPGRGDARRDGPGRAARAVARTVDAGERVVGVVRPRGEPLLRRPRRASCRRLHHPQLDGRDRGGDRVVARRPAPSAARRSTGTRTRPPTGSATRRSTPSPPTTTASWASSSSTGTTCARSATPTTPPCVSPARW